MSSQLLKDIEELFASSEQRVLAAFPATKCTPSAQSSRGKRKLPKPDGKPRVLVLTAKRRSVKRGFKGTLHIAKLSQGKYQVRKSLRLKFLARMEAFIDSPGQQEYFELAFVQRGFTTSGEARLAFEVRNATVRSEILGSIFTFCRTHEKQPPQVVGIDKSELEAAAVLYGKYMSEADRAASGKLPSSASDPQLATRASQPIVSALLAQSAGAGAGGAGALDGAGAGGAPGNPLWAQREDRHLASLLEVVSVGAGSVEDLQERLTTELAALEDANVHEILENGDMVDRVLGGLESTLGLLDDLEENLNIFDTKLRHMREDIAAIEGRNNRLQLHSRNNQRLLDTLGGVVAALKLSSKTEDVLRYSAFSASNLQSIVDAAWELQRSSEALSPAGAAGTAGTTGGSVGEQLVENRVPPGLAAMSAVASQRQRLHDVMRVFLNKATAFLSDEFTHITDPVQAKLATLSGPARLRPPDHSSIRRRAAELAPLLEVIRVMRPAATGPLRDVYCQAVNTLLHKELAAGVGELRRGLASGEGAPEPDVILSRAAETARQGELRAVSRTLDGGLGRTTSATGRGEGRSVSDAYETLLTTFVPVLADEAKQCIRLMFPGTPSRPGEDPTAAAAAAAAARGKSVRFIDSREQATTPLEASSPEVEATMAALFQGVESEIRPLVDSLKPQRALLGLPMLGLTLEWTLQLDGRPGCGPIYRMLEEFEERLRRQLEAYVQERVGAIQRYDGRSSMAGSSVKSVHVMPFVTNFQQVGERLEELLLRWDIPQSARGPRLLVSNAPSPAMPPRRMLTPPSRRKPPRTLPADGGSAAATAAAAAPAKPAAVAFAAMPSPFEGASARRFTSEATESSLATASEDREGSEGGGGGRGGTQGTELSFMSTDTEGGEASGAAAAGGGASAASARRPGSGGGQAPGPQGPLAAAAGGAIAAAGAAAGAGAGQGEAGLEDEDEEAESIGAVLRELADWVYECLMKAMMASIEAAAASDPKHGQRLRLENYAALQRALQVLPSQRVPHLGRLQQEVSGLCEGALRAYIEQQVDYFKFTRVLEFSRKLDDLLESVSPSEVPLQLNYQPQDVRQLLSITMAGIDKKLGQVYARIVKHLRGSSPHLVAIVWDKLEGICLQRWGRMQEQIRQCYPGIALQPPPEELKRIFRAAKANS